MNVNSNLANSVEHCAILFRQRVNIKNKRAYELYYDLILNNIYFFLLF